MAIRAFIKPGAFDPEAIRAIIEAFDAAYEKLGNIDEPEVAREVIAGRLSGKDLVSGTQLVCWKPRSANRNSRG
jgi:hypothetical protein